MTHIFVRKQTISVFNNGLLSLSEIMLDFCSFDSWEQVSVNSYSKIMHFIEENSLENVVWKTAAILCRPQCVKMRPQYRLCDYIFRAAYFSLKLTISVTGGFETFQQLSDNSKGLNNCASR